jgi:hypothetical protein
MSQVPRSHQSKPLRPDAAFGRDLAEGFAPALAREPSPVLFTKKRDGTDRDVQRKATKSPAVSDSKRTFYMAISKNISTVNLSTMKSCDMKYRNTAMILSVPRRWNSEIVSKRK